MAVIKNVIKICCLFFPIAQCFGQSCIGKTPGKATTKPNFTNEDTCLDLRGCNIGYIPPEDFLDWGNVTCLG